MEQQRVVLNKAYGGFEVSKEIQKVLRCTSYGDIEGGFISRMDKRLIDLVLTYQDRNPTLKIVSFPKGKYHHIVEYDGVETLLVSDSPIVIAG